MREMILSKIQAQIEDGDDEIVEIFGKLDEIKKRSDQELLEVYDFMVGFRG